MILISFRDQDFAMFIMWEYVMHVIHFRVAFTIVSANKKNNEQLSFNK